MRAYPHDFQEILDKQKADQSIFEKAKQYATDYMQNIRQGNVFPEEESIANPEVFDESLPDIPGNPHDVPRMMHTCGSPAKVAQTGAPTDHQ